MGDQEDNFKQLNDTLTTANDRLFMVCQNATSIYHGQPIPNIPTRRLLRFDIPTQRLVGVGDVTSSVLSISLAPAQFQQALIELHSGYRAHDLRTFGLGAWHSIVTAASSFSSVVSLHHAVGVPVRATVASAAGWIGGGLGVLALGGFLWDLGLGKTLTELFEPPHLAPTGTTARMSLPGFGNTNYSGSFGPETRTPVGHLVLSSDIASPSGIPVLNSWNAPNWSWQPLSTLAPSDGPVTSVAVDASSPAPDASLSAENVWTPSQSFLAADNENVNLAPVLGTVDDEDSANLAPDAAGGLSLAMTPADANVSMPDGSEAFVPSAAPRSALEVNDDPDSANPAPGQGLDGGADFANPSSNLDKGVSDTSIDGKAPMQYDKPDHDTAFADTQLDAGEATSDKHPNHVGSADGKTAVSDVALYENEESANPLLDDEADDLDSANPTPSEVTDDVDSANAPPGTGTPAGGDQSYAAVDDDDADGDGDGD